MLFPLSLAIACSDLPPIESKQGCECLEAFKSHPGWLLSHPTGVLLAGALGSSFPEHIRGRRSAAHSGGTVHQDTHAAHNFSLSVCLTGARPPDRPDRKKRTGARFMSWACICMQGFFFSFWRNLSLVGLGLSPSMHRYQLQCVRRRFPALL